MTTNSDSPENRQQPSEADSTPLAPTPQPTPSAAESTAAPRRRRPSRRTIWIGGAVAGVLALGGAGIAIADEVNDGSDPLDDATRDRVAAAATAYTNGGELTDAERDDDGGYDAEVRLDDGTEVDVRLDEDYTVVSSDNDDSAEDSADDRGATDDDGTADQGSGSAGSTDADDAALTADETTRASDAAIAETGEGEVVDVDRSDDRDHAFEVEVRLADGSEVEVHLDADFAVVSSTPSD